MGLATEVASKTLEWAIEKNLADKLVGLVAPENHASARVLTKIGFLDNGRDIYFGTEFDTYRLPMKK